MQYFKGLNLCSFILSLQVNEEHVGLVMEALSHRRAEVTDMGPVAGNDGRTRMCLTCPSRLVLTFILHTFDIYVHNCVHVYCI